jgi:predicted nucleotidyltransferase/DNA-binding Xre family transcriptional regulator
MYKVDSVKFRLALTRKGLRSVSELARVLDIHRNTIQNYLKGMSVFNERFERILAFLELSPEDLIVNTKDTTPSLMTASNDTSRNIHSEALLIASELADAICDMMDKNGAVVLFGSRATGKARPYSDIDIGVFAYEGLTHQEYLPLCELKNQYEDTCQFTFDLINLNAAEKDFLDSIIPEVTFLAGSARAFRSLTQVEQHSTPSCMIATER